MTAHWLAREAPGSPLILRTALFAFHNVMGKHDGKNLANISVHLMDRAGMTANVGHSPDCDVYLTNNVLRLGILRLTMHRITKRGWSGWRLSFRRVISPLMQQTTALCN